MASVSVIPKSAKSRQVSLEQEKTVDEIWRQVQAKVIQLAGGDAKNVRKLGIDDVLGYLDSFQDSKKPQKAQRLKGVIDKTLQCIQTVGSIVSSGVSTVFGPADMCCNALTFVIQAWQGYEGIFENLAELLEKCIEFLDRLEYYNENMDARLMRVACQNLELFVEICERTIKLRKKHTRFLAFTKMLFLNDDGIQGLLGRMDRLNSKESLLVAAQTFEIVNDSAENIKTIVDGQKEQRNTQDAKERRQTIVEALGFQPIELSQKGEPISNWKRSFDVYKISVIADTSEWLWEDRVFLDWSQAPQPQTPILILQGSNGSGKTSLMANAINHFQKSQNNPTSRIVTAYFFPEHDSKVVEQDPLQVLETASKALLWQISVSFEAMAKSVAHIAQTTPGFDGWLDIWDQLFVNNTERHNSDTTFFIFVDGLDTDMRSFVTVFQKLCSTEMGKVRIMLTAGQRMVTECSRHMKDVKFEVIPIADRNGSDVEKYINYRMDAMLTLRDYTRPGISDWRKRILVDLSAKCAGDFYKLNSSLDTLAQMDLIEDIESVLADANKTRSDQIDAEIIHLNKTRTPKEIQEINDIILWVDNGRRWFPVDMIETLISLKYRSPDGSQTVSSRSLAVSLLPLSQKLAEKYTLFEITDANTVRWRTPETKDRVPSKSTPDENMALGLPRIQETEINIVRHFLQNVCPGEMYSRFDFEQFFETKLGAQHRECICRDPDNAHVKMAIAYLTVMTDETMNTHGILEHARRDLLFHFKQVDLSAADKKFKVQVGPLLVRLLTEEKGITSLFLPTESLSLFDWARTEYFHLKDVRAEWLYSTEGTREVLRWLSDTTVAKCIQGDLAKSFVEGITSTGGLHASVLSHAATHLARQIYHKKPSQMVLVSASLFLRGYLLRVSQFTALVFKLTLQCDPEISKQMANDASFYIAKVADAAKELEDPRNFTLETTDAIEAWAAVALNKAENTAAQDSLWEFQAFTFMGSICQNLPIGQAVTRAQKAAKIDPDNLDARYIVAADRRLARQEQIDALSKMKQDLELNLEKKSNVLLARVTMALGNRLWDMGEDRDLATQTHLECLSYGYCGFASREKYSSILDRHTKISDFSRVLNFIDGVNKCWETWRPHVDEMVIDLIDSLSEWQDVAKAADNDQKWDVLEAWYNRMIEFCISDGFDELVFALRRYLAGTRGESSDEARRESRITLYETALEGIKDSTQTKENIGTYIIYMAVDNLAAAYAEKGFAPDSSSETVELYVSKLVGLLTFAENDEESLRAVTPVFCLVRHHRSNGNHADLTKAWTRKIMLEIIELLSDDDESDDYEAYIYLHQLLIALGDIENSRVAVAMLKWGNHVRFLELEEKKLQRVKTEYITKGFQKEQDAEKSHVSDSQDGLQSSKDVSRAEAVKSDVAVTAVDVETEGMANLPSVSTTDEQHMANSAATKDCFPGQHNTDSSPPSQSQAPIEETPLLSWTSWCDACNGPRSTEDMAIYVCLDCVENIFVESKCYTKLKKGEELEESLDCKDHGFFYVPAWKRDVEFPKASVPVYSTADGSDGEVELQGWMLLETWRNHLRKLYIED